MIDSRDLDELHPAVKALALQFIGACHMAGIELVVTSTYRDAERQNALYAQGRTKPGKRVTNARAGYSFHNFRCAFDVVPKRDGQLVWGTTTAADKKLWERIGAIGVETGLEWGGNWASFPDMPHFQLTHGITLAQFRAGTQLPDTRLA